MELLATFWSDTLTGQTHVLLAALALVLGPLIFTRPKGTRTHKWLGYGYLGAMLVVNISALAMYELSRGPNLFHFFAVVSLVSIVPGFICVLRGAIVSHYFFMSWSYFGLLAAFLSQVATQTGAIPRLAEAMGGASGFALVFAFTGLLSFFAARLINSRAKQLLPRYAGEPSATS